MCESNPIAVVIPAFQPDTGLIKYVEQISQNDNFDVFIVNDGSDKSLSYIFSELAILPRVIVLNHKRNYGKGHAFKTAFHYILANRHERYQSIITADADGQHALKDLFGLAQKSQDDPFSLWLGIRYFDSSVPLRSRVGNYVTTRLFKMLVGGDIHDTQTGLRAIPINILSDILEIKSDGYEFEFHMLIIAIKRAWSIKQISIDTIYFNQNKSSHYKPIIDSFKIYLVLFLAFLHLK